MNKSNDDRFRGFNFARVNLFLLGFIALLLAGAALKLTSDVVLPFVVAVLLTFVLEPFIIALERIKIPRSLGAIVLVILLGAGIYVVGAILFSSVRTILTLFPRYELRFTEIYQMIAELLELPYDEHLSLFQNLWGQSTLRGSVQSFAFGFSESFFGFLADTVMVVLFVVFLLLELGHFRERVELAFAGKLSERIQKIIAATIVQVARYLTVKFFVSLATGVLVTVGLGLIGVDFPVVWGVISFIMNFIPNIGSIAAGGGVTLFALVQFWPQPGPIIAAAALMLVVNFAIGNFIEPRLQGQNLGLSPFVILASLLAWGWLWGFAGLVLAVPMTVIVKIVCENVPILEPVSIMLGSYKAAKLKEVAAEHEARGSGGDDSSGAAIARGDGEADRP